MASEDTKIKDVDELYKSVRELSKTYKSLSKAEFVRSGSVVLDALLGGGIPRGTFILWSAENGCGKSTGALHISRTYCLQDKKVLYLDYEGGVNLSQIEGIGLKDYLYSEENPKGTFFLFQCQTYKDGEKILDKLMASVDLVVIDSMTAILTEKVKGSSSEDVLPGIDARVSSTFMKKYKAEAVRCGVTWVMINQIRTKIAMGFGQVTHDEEAGGQALRFYPDIRLRMKKAFKGTLEREEKTSNGLQKVPFGAVCDIWAEKNRHMRPKIPLSLTIIFGKGISNEFAYAQWLLNQGFIIKTGSWFNIKFNDHDEKFQGMDKIVEWVTTNRNEVKEFINSNGGYKLILDEASPAIDIGLGPDNVESYDEATAVGEFEEIAEEPIKEEKKVKEEKSKKK